ncbi:hypothetical protein PAXRUDRAFT_771461, partial [Paxillus rubicundulus Ve08.2h10]
CNPSLLSKRIPSLLCFTLVILVILLPHPLVFIPLPSLGFVPKSSQSCRSPLEVIHPSFPLLMSIMPSTSSVISRRMLSRSPKPLPISLINPSTLILSARP